MSVYLEKAKELPEIPGALKAIVGADVTEALRFMDSSVYDETKGYSVWKLITKEASFVLKRSEDEEGFNAEVRHYGLLSGLPVPKLLGAAEGHLLLEFVEGTDLKEPTDEAIRAFSESLTAIMNAFPMGRGYEKGRYERYIKRLEKRAGYLSDEPELLKAFSVFFERQRDIPLTLSNADLLPMNVLYDGEKATIIDWEFGGFMPYALDIARFIAHGRASGSVTPFRMTDAQKELFLDLVYGGLEAKPSREVFDRDILLAEFNECIEILEYYFGDKTVERDKVYFDYYPRAAALAGRITGS